MSRWILAILVGLLAGAWEVAARPFLPLPLMARPLLPAVVLCLIGSGRSKALAVALSGAVILDLYAPGTLDLATVRYMGIVFLLDLIGRHWLTNRSLYSAVALVWSGRALERGSAWIIGSLLTWFGRSAYGWAADPSFLPVVIWDALIVALGFLLVAFFTRRFLLLPPGETLSGKRYAK